MQKSCGGEEGRGTHSRLSVPGKAVPVASAESWGVHRGLREQCPARGWAPGVSNKSQTGQRMMIKGASPDC